MKYIICLYFCFLVTQDKPVLETTFLSKTILEEKGLISIDNFKTSYSVDNNIFYKKNTNKTKNYSNIQLGNIETVNTFNPLKINLFYKDFNTAVILDNRLAEVYKIDFNALEFYKNVTHISTGNDNTLWLYNQDTQQLELYDYKTKKAKALTLPIESDVLDLKSNYNFCWLLTEKYIYKYSYFGSLISKIENTGFTELIETNENIILKNENTLFYLKKDTTQPIEIKLPKLLIKAFFVNDETLYIYDSEFLYKYQIKTN